MQKALLIDFGSTYTKVAVVDLDDEEVLGISQAPTTAGTDIMTGLKYAIEKLGEAAKGNAERRACSSAAGGLRMVAIGLVKGLTAEAAKRAALGAGAKVLSTYAHGLTSTDLREIEQVSPDIILLAGGTDGGNHEAILSGARTLAGSSLQAPIIVAGNRMAAEMVASILTEAGKAIFVTENVMPELDCLNVEPAQASIRNLFMERIVHAKGLDGAQSFVGDILMPTPMAVLKGARILADGTDREEGLGELLVIDVGGSTTDVHSVGQGAATVDGIVLKGLPEPYAKRTVEGDLGIRQNALHILTVVGKNKLLKNIPFHDKSRVEDVLEEVLKNLAVHTDRVPMDEMEKSIDVGLARTAAELATERHVGILEQVHTPQGKVYVQRGKDLTNAKAVIGTGGIFRNGQDPLFVLEATLFKPENPLCLRPRQASLYVDESYFLYALGLLSDLSPDAALRIMKRHLKRPSLEKRQS